MKEVGFEKLVAGAFAQSRDELDRASQMLERLIQRLKDEKPSMVVLRDLKRTVDEKLRDEIPGFELGINSDYQAGIIKPGRMILLKTQLKKYRELLLQVSVLAKYLIDSGKEEDGNE